MRFVCGEAEHDEVGVESVQTVPCVRVVVWSDLLTPYEIHYLMLSLTGRLHQKHLK